MAVVLAVTAWSVYVLFTIEQQFIEGRADSARLVIEAIVYLVLVTLLATSAVAYLITRIGLVLPFAKSSAGATAGSGRLHRSAFAAVDDGPSAS